MQNERRLYAAFFINFTPMSPARKRIFAIIGSASHNSSNHKLVDFFIHQTKPHFEVTIADDLKTLPHFDPELSTDNPPKEIIEFRNYIESADAILISTPEYVFSIPSGLKNAIEWCIATTVFTDKPVGIITASAHGQKGHEELQLIMTTIMAKFNAETTLLIQGVKGKVNSEGQVTDDKTLAALQNFITACTLLF
jgi:chromate reductase, NAD(P)H dehydrogenase (quinone)